MLYMLKKKKLKFGLIGKKKSLDKKQKANFFFQNS